MQHVTYFFNYYVLRYNYVKCHNCGMEFFTKSDLKQTVCSTRCYVDLMSKADDDFKT